MKNIRLKKILIADDEPDYVKIVALRLRKSGYHIIVATNGEEALACARTANPDLILLDIRLPKMDGFEVCRRVKKDPLLSRIPVLFASAHVSDNVRETVFRCGGEGYLEKPFENEVMLDSIHRILDPL